MTGVDLPGAFMSRCASLRVAGLRIACSLRCAATFNVTRALR
jgi:hypothetical protein